MTDKTPIVRIKDTAAFIEWPDIMIEISIDPDDEAEGLIEFDVWDAAPWSSHEWLGSDIIVADDYHENGHEALRSWAVATRYSMTIDADD